MRISLRPRDEVWKPVRIDNARAASGLCARSADCRQASIGVDSNDPEGPCAGLRPDTSGPATQEARNRCPVIFIAGALADSCSVLFYLIHLFHRQWIGRRCPVATLLIGLAHRFKRGRKAAPQSPRAGRMHHGATALSRDRALDPSIPCSDSTDGERSTSIAALSRPDPSQRPRVAPGDRCRARSASRPAASASSSFEINSSRSTKPT